MSQRLESICGMFGQIPDVLEAAWVEAALGDMEKAKRTIDAIIKQHPFELKYRRVEKVAWESCARVLESSARKQLLLNGWEKNG